MDIKANPKTYERLIKRIKEFEGLPLSFLIRRRKLTYLVIIFLLIVGLIQIKSLPQELNPEVEIPYGMVNTVYPGASSADVEEQVTKEIEAKVASLDGIKKMESSSSFGLSRVSVEFEPDQDLEDSIRKLKDKADEAKSELPEDAEDPNVIEIRITDFPILSYSLKGPNYDRTELKSIAEDIKDQIKGVSGVDEVEITGGTEKEIKVELKPDKLVEFNVSSDQVTSLINANNVNYPLGSIEIADLKYSLRVQNEFKTADQIADLVITSRNGVDVRLKDIADIYEDFAEQTSYSRLSSNGTQPQDTVTMDIYKKTGGNITEIANQIKSEIEQGAGTLYPQDVEVNLTTDYAYYIEKSISDLVQNGAGTVLIIFVLLIIFMGIREAVITSLAVPFSFFIAFIVMAIMGESLNFITLFSLVLALGLLVDSAVVIVEGMYEKICKYHMTGYSAAMLSVQEYAAPLLSGMLTTVAAFLPLFFVKGIFGQFLKGIPIVVTSTLVAALFVALTIIPTIGTALLKPRKSRDGKNIRPDQKNILSRQLDRLADWYKHTVYSIISVRKNRLIVLIGSWVLFFASLYFPISGYLKMEAFGNPDAEYFWIYLEMPQGTVSEKTNQVAMQMEQELLDTPHVRSFVTTVGSGGSENKATVTMNLTKTDERKITSPQIAEIVKDKLKNITQGEIQVEQESGGPPSGEPLEAHVSGPDLLELERVSEDMKRILEDLPGAENVKTSVEYTPGEFLVKFNPEIMTQYGLNTVGVAGQLRTGVSGNDNAKITRLGDEIKINVGFEPNQVDSLNYLNNLTITSTTGEQVALGNLAQISLEPSLSSINRVDEERSVTISGQTSQGANINEVMTAYKKEMQNYNLPAGYSITYGGMSQEQNEVYLDMLFKMIIGIILILFILITQFNSFRQTFIVLITIPLALIGVIWGMTIANMTLDIPAFIGIVSLAGIVVNNAIILVDYINKLRRRKKHYTLAQVVATGGKARLRPIIFTTTTTVLGLLPLSIREPDWRNMGFTIIFGLTFSAFLTLFVIPSMYVSLETGREKRRLRKEQQEQTV